MTRTGLVCRYADCAHQNRVQRSESEQVTCPLCREWMGLPPLVYPAERYASGERLWAVREDGAPLQLFTSWESAMEYAKILEAEQEGQNDDQ
jgi:hypothetical protein